MEMYLTIHSSLLLFSAVFRITLPCTGQMTADVDVIIGLNITMISAANMTELKFMRRKTCFEGKGNICYFNQDFELILFCVGLLLLWP